MNEQAGVGHDATGSEIEALAATGVTAGRLLREAREASGIHIDALAAVLKVPVSKLQALEDDQYEAFPDAVFMRGVAASVCRTLKLDAGPVLALLPHGTPLPLKMDRGINTVFKGNAARFGHSGSALERPKSRYAMFAGAVLVVAAVAVAMFPRHDSGAETASVAVSGNDVKDVSVVTPVDPVAIAASDAVAVAANVAGAVAAPNALAAQPPAPAQPPASAALVVPMSTVPATSAAVATVATVAAVEADKGLEVRAKGETWVQIKSATTGTVVQRTLAAGESVVAAGSPPWNVVIGRAGMADVMVRGQPMPLNVGAKDTVARFEVK